MERIELSPGDYFLVADRTILVDKYTSVLAVASKIGGSKGEIAYLFTFEGKLNNKDERDTVTIAIPIEHILEMTDGMLCGLENLQKVVEEG